MGEEFNLPMIEKLYLVGEEGFYDKELFNKLNINKVIWCAHVSKVPSEFRRDFMIIEKPSLYEKWRWKQTNPISMESELAREWTLEQKMVFKVSAKFPIKDND